MPQIEFPAAGIDRTMAWQKQPPYTAADMLNVVPIGSISGRARGGSRPGLVRAYPNAQFIASGRLGMLNVVHPAFGTNTGEWADRFGTYATSGQLGSPWALAWSPEAGAELPDIRENPDGIRMATVVRSDAIVGDDQYRAAAVEAATSLPGYDSSKTYSIITKLRPFDWSLTYPYDVDISGGANPDLAFWGASIFCRIAATSTDWKTNGIEVRVEPYYTGVANGWQVRIQVFDSTTLKATRFTPVSSTAAMTVQIDITTSTAQVWFNGVSIGGSWNTTASGGHVMGFYLYHLQEPMASYIPSTGISVEEFRTEFYLPTASITLEDSPSIISTSINGLLEWIDTAGQVRQAASTSSATLHYTKRLNAVELGGKLWIADNDTTIIQDTGATLNDGSTGSGTGVRLHKAGTEFTGRGITVANHVVTLYSPSDGVPVGTYKIASVVAASGPTHSYIELADAPASNPTDVVYRVERSAKVFNPGSGANGTLSVWTQDFKGTRPKGAMPSGCRLIGRFRNRIILAGRPANVFYMSREGDPLDWNAGDDPDDPGRAYGGTTGQAGRIGNPLTAIATHSDDFFILSTASELWLARADIIDGSPLLLRSDKVGILSDRAWCTLPNGGMIFLGPGGLYELPPGGAGEPINISDSRLPRELNNIDLSLYSPMLAWDEDEQRVIIFMGGLDLWISGAPPGGITHWMFDYKRRAFFPWRYAEEIWPEPSAIVTHTPIGETGPKVLQMGYDGIIRYFSNNAGEDYAQPYPAAADRPNKPIPARVLFGPLKTADDRDVLWSKLKGIMGLHSSPTVTWKLFGADTTENAYETYRDNRDNGTASYLATGTWTTGRNPIADVRARATVFFLLLECTSFQRWEMEEIHAEYGAMAGHRPL